MNFSLPFFEDDDDLVLFAILEKEAQSRSGGGAPMLFFTNTNNGATISNTIVEASLFSGMVGSAPSSRVILPNSNIVGTVYPMRFEGRYAATGAPAGRFLLRLGGTGNADGTIIADTGPFTLQNTVDAVWAAFVQVFVRAIGAGGSVIVPRLRVELGNGIAGAQTLTVAYASATTAIDFSVNEIVDLSFGFGAADPANVIFMSGVNMGQVG